MSPDAWQKLSATLDSLLDLPRTEQRQALDTLRDSDPEFCREVEALLGEQDTDECFETPPADLIDTLPVFNEDPQFDDGRAGRYEIQSEIARGGMGAIYRATDAEIGRTLAVKVLLPAAKAFPDAEAGFDREARITGRLQHPGIPPVHEMSRLADGTPFFTMKLIEGRTLSEVIRDADWPGRAIGVFEQICRTLAYAHSKGIIHRDLKPGNVMVGAFGEVQVMDWGLARDLNSGEGSMSDIVGTPAYMAPEQARGEADLDERCDVFGLGALLCAMITGKPPYGGETQQQTLRHAANTETAEAFDSLTGAGADTDLLAIARRALAANRDDRYLHAGEMADAVTAYRESLAERLRQAELARAKAVVKAAEERRRRKVTMTLAAAVMAIVIGAVAVWGWSERLASQKAARATALNGQIRTALDSADRERGAMLAALADPVSVNALLNDRTPWRNRLKTLAALQAQAAELAESDREVLDPALDERQVALKQNLESDQADFAFAERADSLLIEMYEEPGTRLDLVPAYRSLFAERGWMVFDEPPEEVAARIAASPVKLLALAALDDTVTFTLRSNPRGPTPSIEKGLAVARAIDRDEWRNRLRTLKVFFDEKEVSKLTVTLDPRSQPPQMLRFVARLRKYHKLDAIRTLNAALRAYPSDFWLLYSYGEETLEKDPPESLAAYRAALALRPRSIPVLNMFGGACLKRQDYATADACFLQALEIAPDFRTVKINLAVSRWEQNNSRENLAVLNGLLADEPKALTMTAMGRRHAIFDDDEKARSCFQRAVAAEPGPRVARLNHDAFEAMLKVRERLLREETRTVPWAELRSTLRGELTAESPEDAFFDRPGRRRQGYLVELRAGTTYRLTIDAAFDPVLRVETAKFATVVSNDMQSDALLRRQLTFDVPADGVYRVVVTTAKAGETGAFTLRGQSGTRVPARTVKNDTLRRTDKVSNGKFIHSYEFKLAAGETAILRLAAPSFDPRLVIHDVKSRSEIADAAEIHPFDHRWTRVEIFSPQGGTYVAGVTSATTDTIGKYRLTIDTVASWKP